MQKGGGDRRGSERGAEVGVMDGGIVVGKQGGGDRGDGEGKCGMFGKQRGGQE